LINLYGKILPIIMFSDFFLVFTISGGFLIVGQYWSNILIVLPKNISHLPIMMEYFIDQEKYFYLILLHINAVVCIGSAVMLAIGTMLITYFQNICGMFRIAWYEQRCRNDYSNLNRNKFFFNNIIV